MCILHFAAQLGDQPLGGFRKKLGQGERGHALDQGGRHHDKDQRTQQAVMMLADDIVHQVLGRGGQHQSRHTIDHHQHKPESQNPAARPDELFYIGQKRTETLGPGNLIRARETLSS